MSLRELFGRQASRRFITSVIPGAIAISVGLLSFTAATVISAADYNLEEAEEGALTGLTPMWIQVWGYSSVALVVAGIALVVLALIGLAARTKSTQYR